MAIPIVIFTNKNMVETTIQSILNNAYMTTEGEEFEPIMITDKEELKEFIKRYLYNSRGVFSEHENSLHKLKTKYMAFPIGFVLNFGYKIPTVVHENIFLLNIHFSVLPCCKGPLPVEATILSQAPYIGLTMHQVTDVIDAGNMLYTYAEPNLTLYLGLTAGELFIYLEKATRIVLGKLLGAFGYLHNYYKVRGFFEDDPELYAPLKRVVEEDVIQIRKLLSITGQVVAADLHADLSFANQLFEGTVLGAGAALIAQRKRELPEVGYVKKVIIDEKMSRVSFESMTAREVVARILAFNPRNYARATVKFNGKSRDMVLYKARIVPTDTPSQLKPGQIVFDKNRGLLRVGTRLEEVEIFEAGFEGKKRLAASQLVSLKDKLERFM